MRCSDMDKSSSMHASAAAGSTAEAFSPAQANEIRSDLETIMNAHLDVTDDKVAELLQFFNKSVNAVLHGATCDPRMIERILQDRFHTTVSCRFRAVYFLQCLYKHTMPVAVAYSTPFLTPMFMLIPASPTAASVQLRPGAVRPHPRALHRPQHPHLRHVLRGDAEEPQQVLHHPGTVSMHTFLINPVKCSDQSPFVNPSPHPAVPGPDVCEPEGLPTVRGAHLLRGHHAAVLDPLRRQRRQRSDPLEGHPSLPARQGESCVHCDALPL